MSEDEIDGNGLPFMDDETLAKWRAEALESLPLADDWADLVACLRWANELDRRGIEMEKLPKGLTAAERSLNAILLFMQRQPSLMREGGIAPLMRLHSAMVDVADGIASPLFKPVAKGSGRPGNGITVDTIKGFAARAMSELMEAGDTENDAATKVAKAIRKGRHSDMGDIETKTIKNWRDRLNSGIGPGASAIAIQQYKEELPHDLGSTPRERGQALLRVLAERGRMLG
ncbi:hypothetical+protein [Methylocapsa aurea]|uniref:hypothetical protein n=1 Tax=Methylocapsa aurea TaxID=663610 RepID=UPI003D187CAD